MTTDELKDLRSKNTTTNLSPKSRSLPKAFTEKGLYMLATILKSQRADVSVNRSMIAQYFPMYYQALTSGNERLRGIENNTAAIMRSNEAIEKSSQAILDRIDGLRNNTWRVPVV